MSGFAEILCNMFLSKIVSANGRTASSVMWRVRYGLGSLPPTKTLGEIKSASIWNGSACCTWGFQKAMLCSVETTLGCGVLGIGKRVAAVTLRAHRVDCLARPPPFGLNLGQTFTVLCGFAPLVLQAFMASALYATGFRTASVVMPRFRKGHGVASETACWWDESVRIHRTSINIILQAKSSCERYLTYCEKD